MTRKQAALGNDDLLEIRQKTDDGSALKSKQGGFLIFTYTPPPSPLILWVLPYPVALGVPCPKVVITGMYKPRNFIFFRVVITALVTAIMYIPPANSSGGKNTAGAVSSSPAYLFDHIRSISDQPVNILQKYLPTGTAQQQLCTRLNRKVLGTVPTETQLEGIKTLLELFAERPDYDDHMPTIGGAVGLITKQADTGDKRAIGILHQLGSPDFPEPPLDLNLREGFFNKIGKAIDTATWGMTSHYSKIQRRSQLKAKGETVQASSFYREQILNPDITLPPAAKAKLFLKARHQESTKRESTGSGKRSISLGTAVATTAIFIGSFMARTVDAISTSAPTVNMSSPAVDSSGYVDVTCSIQSCPKESCSSSMEVSHPHAPACHYNPAVHGNSAIEVCTASPGSKSAPLFTHGKNDGGTLMKFRTKADFDSPLTLTCRAGSTEKQITIKPLPHLATAAKTGNDKSQLPQQSLVQASYDQTAKHEILRRQAPSEPLYNAASNNRYCHTGNSDRAAAPGKP